MNLTQGGSNMGNQSPAPATAPDSYPMTGGDGTYSYSRNSFYQRIATENAKITVANAIAENLDIRAILSSGSSYSVCIADLGCSIGPNTFFAMQNIVDAVQQKYLSEGLASQMPEAEFQVFFNDHVSNDFNALFTSLPSGRQYFAAGVPGSFHGRLFPKSSLHVVYSSHALHWLSKVPEELLDKNSQAWNGGRIHYTDAPNEVGEVYAVQFAQDMKNFLEARAHELVAGGLMVLTMMGNPNEIPHSCAPAGIWFNFLGSCLRDMVKDGKVTEDKMDKFNIPIYAASPKDIRWSIEETGCFNIERMDFTLSGRGGSVDGHACAMHCRAGLQGIFSKHFGSEIIDELFSRYQKKVEESLSLIESMTKEATQLLIVLKRK